ncbi:MAG: acyl carrier protein [Myxococcales bacterium]|nr:acyl carrier protein [Myxococcales bacterium]MDD9971441.1 acyl carrier protein [Myxococcales bacterium]
MTTVDRLMDLAAGRFKVARESLTADADVFESLGIDSMQVMELLSEVEDEFDIEIPDYELRDVKTFAQLAACIDRR